MFADHASDLEFHFKRTVQEFFPYAQSISIRGHILLELDHNLNIPIFFTNNNNIRASTPSTPSSLVAYPEASTFSTSDYPISHPCSSLKSPRKEKTHSNFSRNRRKSYQPTRYCSSEHSNTSTELQKTPSPVIPDSHTENLHLDEHGALNLSTKTLSNSSTYNPYSMDYSTASTPAFNNSLRDGELSSLSPFSHLLFNPLITHLPPSRKCSPLSGKSSRPRGALRSKITGIKQKIPNIEGKKSSINRIFTCNQCKEQFSTLSLLSQHTTAVHSFYRCVICQAQFTQRSNLQRHALKHVGFKPFLCRLCDKAYYRKDHLMRHLEMSHPLADPQTSIHVKLTYSECLDYLEQQPRIKAEQEVRDNSEEKNLTT